MEGAALVRLAAAMERHPDVGLIQTLPVIVNGNSFFARMQQFAGRVYGPVIAAGIAWWHGAEGNYWGHNAIIRTRAFADHAGLPTLRGRKPFGGHILSHDFVEAALLRRAGWAVHMVPALRGSYEESPPALTDLAVRDRRWCQGNLQHAAVLPARGLASGQPAAPADRHRLLHHGAALAAVPRRAASSVRWRRASSGPPTSPPGRACSPTGRSWIRCAPCGCSSAPCRCCWCRSCWPGHCCC